MLLQVTPLNKRQTYKYSRNKELHHDQAHSNVAI